MEITAVAQAMFSRRSEENLFRFMRPRGLDAMDSYAKVPDDPDRIVPNPAKASAAKADLAAAETSVVATALGTTATPDTAITNAADALVAAKTAAAEIPAKIRLGDIRPDAMRLDEERKHLHDAIRMATSNAEQILAKALGPHCARAEDKAHNLLAEAFATSANLQVIGDELHVNLEALSALRCSGPSPPCAKHSPPPKPSTQAPAYASSTRLKATEPAKRRTEQPEPTALPSQESWIPRWWPYDGGPVSGRNGSAGGKDCPGPLRGA